MRKCNRELGAILAEYLLVVSALLLLYALVVTVDSANPEHYLPTEFHDSGVLGWISQTEKQTLDILAMPLDGTEIR